MERPVHSDSVLMAGCTRWGIRVPGSKYRQAFSGRFRHRILRCMVERPPKPDRRKKLYTCFKREIEREHPNNQH